MGGSKQCGVMFEWEGGGEHACLTQISGNLESKLLRRNQSTFWKVIPIPTSELLLATVSDAPGERFDEFVGDRIRIGLPFDDGFDVLIQPSTVVDFLGE